MLGALWGVLVALLLALGAVFYLPIRTKLRRRRQRRPDAVPQAPAIKGETVKRVLNKRGAKELDSVVVKGVEIRRGMTVRALADSEERALLVTDIMEDQHGQYMVLFRSIPNHTGKNYLVQSEDWELLTPIE
jgi:type II secretory pathway component PulF